MIRFADAYRMPTKARVTKALIVVNILSYIATHFTGTANELFQVGGFIPAELVQADLLAQEYLPGYSQSLAEMRPFTPVIVLWSMFLHGNFFHLLGNMLFLWVLGFNVEARMGWRRYLLFYLSCGATAALFHALSDLDSAIPMIGASGAISGLVGAYLTLFASHEFRLTLGSIRSRNYRDILIPFKALFVIWILNQLFMLLLQNPAKVQDVAVFAHVGGFLCGLFLADKGGPILKKRYRFKVVQGGKRKTDNWGVD